MNFVMGVCDQVMVLDFGNLIAAGPPEDIRSNPAVIAAYLGDETDEDTTTDDDDVDAMQRDGDRTTAASVATARGGA